VKAVGRELSGELTLEAVRRLPPGSAFRLVVSGSSMAPVLISGDEVLATRTGSSAGWRLGDILVVDLPGAGPVVHRVLWTRRDTVRLRGDGSGRMDPPVPRDSVLGRVVEVTRAGRDVTEGRTRRLAAWTCQLAAAAAHRIRRRVALALGAGAA
jgi:hypothetical protein